MRKQLYLDIKNKIKAIKDDNDLQLIKHFDIWNQQVDFLEAETPFEYPAVFIEFEPIQWQTQANRVQQAELLVKIHIVTRWFAQTADYSPTEDISLNYLDIPDKIFIAIQGTATTNSGGLMRISSIVNHNHGDILDSIEVYKTLITNTLAMPQQQAVNNVAPVITE